MNFKVLNRACLVLLGGFLSFCTYSPEEDFFKEIEGVDFTQFSISLDSYDSGDTIHIEGNTEFTYHLESGNGQVQEVKVYINGEELDRSHQTSGSFEFAPVTGIYQLKIEFVSSSGSGSLADQAGGEAVQVWKQWTIKAYVETPPDIPQVTNSVENGFAVIHWTPYTRTKFEHYRIQAEGKVIYITDPAITSWVDSSYTGYTTKSYYVYTKNSVATAWQSTTINGYSRIPFQATFNPQDSSVNIKISKPQYYGTFNSFSILENNVEVKRLSDVNQLSFTYKTNNTGVNFKTLIGVRSYPNAPATSYSTDNAYVSTSPTRKLSATVAEAAFNEDLNSIIAHSNSTNKAYIIDPLTLTPKDSISLGYHSQFLVPYKEAYAYYFKSGVTEFRQLNLITREEKTIDNEFVNSVSQNQIYTYSNSAMWPDHTYRYGSYVVDMATKQSIASVTKTSSFSPHYLSDDGQFVSVYGNQIFKLNNGTFTSVGTFSQTGYWAFRKDFCEEILNYSGNTVKIYDTNTLTLKRTVTAPAGSGFYSYDPATKCAVFNHQSAKKLYSINIDTNIKKEVKADLTNFIFVSGTIIVNGKDYYKFQ